MKLIIAGTRTFKKVDIGAILKDLELEPSEVVTGGAPGVDTLAFEWAWKNGIPVKVFTADWKKFGRAAGPIRNRQMAEYGDTLLAIWNGRSRGTRNMIQEAQRLCLRTYQRTFTEPQ